MSNDLHVTCGVNTNSQSIIFSSWTKSLDLVERHFVSQNIEFARIDGTLTLPQRQKVLEDFDQTSSVRILLMTLGTGAVGYVRHLP
jgi:SWI/SNF-related matrix-associated actin-dependent regulator of chromatin subfamily A3